MSFRFKNARTKMLAAEDDFEVRGHKFRAGTFIIPSGDVNALRASIQELGLSAWAVASVPAVKTHEMEIPRIGYVHSWQNTQDEGWVRAALDHYGVPYTYFADQKLRDGNLRAKYDVIIYPDVAGTSQSHSERHPESRPGSHSLQEIQPDAQPRRARSKRRHSRRDGGRRSRRTCQVRGSRRHADHRRINLGFCRRLRPGGRRQRRASRPTVRARIDPARAIYGSEESDRLRLRSEGYPGLLQSGPGLRHCRGTLGWRRRFRIRFGYRAERHAERRAHPHLPL